MIARIDNGVSSAQGMVPRMVSGDKVVFGSTFHLLDEDDKPVKYQRVGHTEADAKIGRISYLSPLGRALIGRQVGYDVEVSTPSGDRYHQIAKLERSEEHTSELQSLMRISYAVFCLTKKRIYITKKKYKQKL